MQLKESNIKCTLVKASNDQMQLMQAI